MSSFRDPMAAYAQFGYNYPSANQVNKNKTITTIRQMMNAKVTDPKLAAAAADNTIILQINKKKKGEGSKQNRQEYLNEMANEKIKYNIIANNVKFRFDDNNNF